MFIKFKRLLNSYSKIRVTGVLKNGKRFKAMEYSSDIAGQMTAFGINLWQGTVWGILPNGKKELIKRVY